MVLQLYLSISDYLSQKQRNNKNQLIIQIKKIEMLPLKQQIEKELRQSFELAYREKLLVMKNHYQMRYQTLHETINNSYKRILQDEVLSAMTRDTTTVNFLEDRVKELYKQIVQNQREVIIQKLGLQYSQLRFQYQQIQKKYLQIKKQTESLSQKQLLDRLSSQQNKSSLSSTLHKKQQQIFELKLQIKQHETLQKQKQSQQLTLQNKVQQLQKQNIMLTNKLLSMDEQLKQTIGVVHTNIQLKDVDVKESQNKVYNLEKTVKDMERNWQVQIRLVEEKCRKKVEMYKDKIEQYKGKILELVRDREDQQDSRVAEVKIQELEKKIMMMSRESEKKMSQLKATRQKDKNQMQRKYESKYRQLQLYYQKLIQQKLCESQKIAKQAAQKIQHEQHEIRRYINYLEQNSTPLSQYTKLQQFTQNLKQHLQQKLIQHQKIVNNFISQNKDQQQRLQDTIKLLSQSEDKCTQFEKIVEELQAKIKMYQQQLGSLKVGEKKLKGLLVDCQAGLRGREEEVVGLRAELQKVRGENVENMGMLGQRQALYLQKCQQVQTLQKRLSRHTNQTELLTQQLLNLQSITTTLKKSLNQKQNQIQTITQDNQYKIQNLNSQIHKNSLSLQSVNEKIQDLTQKCNTLDNTLIITNKQKMEIQANLRKIELENQFVKESEVSFREQHQMYVLEFRKKMEEKCKIVEQLYNQIGGLKKYHSQQLQNQQFKVRKLTMILKKVHRVYSSEIDNLSRSIKDMRIYIESSEKLLKSEIKMMQNNAYLRVKQEMFLIMSNKNDEIRRIKQSLQHDKNQHNNTTKTKLEQFEVSMKQKLQQQIRNYQSLVSNKDKQIQKLQREHKKQAHEIGQQNEQKQNLQKKIKALELAYQNQRIQSKSKINQLIRNFDNQKNKLLEQYDRKQEKLEGELEELVKSVKVLRRELENSRSVGEEQKGKYSQEVERLNRRERELEMEVEKKKLEIISLNECLKMSRQTNTKQQIEIKTLSQKCVNLAHTVTQLQLQAHSLQNQQTIQKSKIDRYSTQNEQLQKQLTQATEQKNKLEQNKIKLEHELKQIRGNIIKSNKSQDLRALQLLDIQTRELSNKVNQLRKVNFNMGSSEKTPLRF